jgi:hypothetical protein
MEGSFFKFYLWVLRVIQYIAYYIGDIYNLKYLSSY